jgi:hypothetical protein
VGERELREALDLVGTTTGKGKVTLRPNQRPLEVPSQHARTTPVNTPTSGVVSNKRVSLRQLFMCSVVRRCGYMEAFEWVAQYVQGK